MRATRVIRRVFSVFAILATVGTTSASAQTAATEQARRDRLWSMFDDKKPTITNCYKMERCEDLADALLHRRHISFIDPLLRTANLADARVGKLLGDCKPTELDHFDIPDGPKRSHADVGTGPVAIYSLPESRSRQRSTVLRFEYWHLAQRTDRDLKGTSILQLQPCRVLANTAFVDGASLDAGFFTFGGDTYHYDIWKYAYGGNDHYAIGIDEMAMDEPFWKMDSGSLYAEFSTQ